MGSHAKSSARAGPGTRVTGILDSIRRIVRVLRVGSRAAEKHVGLSSAQLFVLQALNAGPARSLNELAERTRTHQSSVSVVVQRLVDRGMVSRTRFSGDARRIELSLTPVARRLLRVAPDAVQDRLIGAIERMPAKDQTRLVALLADLVAGMGATQGSVEMFFEEEIPEAAGKKTPSPGNSKSPRPDPVPKRRERKPDSGSPARRKGIKQNVRA